MIVNFKKENSITGEMKLYCCLAVDALYFRPDIKVGPNGVNGFLKNIEVDKKQLTSFENNIEYFISFVRDHWSEIIKAGFVYQINPFFFPIKPIVIHIIPTSHGKANNQIIEKLYTIKNILHNYRIEIMSFSFDGDNAFGPMNQNFYETFINRMIKKIQYLSVEHFQYEFLQIHCILQNAFAIGFYQMIFIWDLQLNLQN